MRDIRAGRWTVRRDEAGSAVSPEGPIYVGVHDEYDGPDGKYPCLWGFSVVEVLALIVEEQDAQAAETEAWYLARLESYLHHMQETTVHMAAAKISADISLLRPLVMSGDTV